jgi:hypothetical protein
VVGPQGRSLLYQLIVAPALARHPAEGLSGLLAVPIQIAHAFRELSSRHRHYIVRVGFSRQMDMLPQVLLDPTGASVLS